MANKDWAGGIEERPLRNYPLWPWRPSCDVSFLSARMSSGAGIALSRASGPSSYFQFCLMVSSLIPRVRKHFFFFPKIALGSSALLGFLEF